MTYTALSSGSSSSSDEAVKKKKKAVGTKAQKGKATEEAKTSKKDGKDANVLAQAKPGDKEGTSTLSGAVDATT